MTTHDELDSPGLDGLAAIQDWTTGYAKRALPDRECVGGCGADGVRLGM